MLNMETFVLMQFVLPWIIGNISKCFFNCISCEHLRLESLFSLDIFFPVLFIIFFLVDTWYGNVSFYVIFASLILFCLSYTFSICTKFLRWTLIISRLGYFYIYTIHLVFRIRCWNRKLQCASLIRYFLLKLLQIFCLIYSFHETSWCCLTIDWRKSCFSVPLFSYQTLRMETLAFCSMHVFKSLW